MAEVLTEWPTIVRTRKAKYPWTEWTNGQIWKVAKDTDFESEPKTFVQGLYAHAKRHGGKVKVGTVGDTEVVFAFSEAPSTNGADTSTEAPQAEAPTEAPAEAAA